jgi:hypothetical protein
MKNFQLADNSIIIENSENSTPAYVWMLNNVSDKFSSQKEQTKKRI